MQKLLSLLLAVFLFSCGNPSADAPAAPIDSIPTVDTPMKRDTARAPEADTSTGIDTLVKGPAADYISFVREQVTGINTATLRKKQFAFTCDEKMTVDYYYRGDEIVKIAVDFGTVGDTYAKEEYYYNKGELLFFYEFVEGGPACEGCITTHEYRSYIRDGKVIHYLKDKNKETCRKCTFDKNSRQYQLLQAGTTAGIQKLFCQ